MRCRLVLLLALLVICMRAAEPTHYHACLTAQAIATDAGLLPRMKSAGIDRIWLIAWGYGHWFAPPEQLAAARAACMAAGLEAQPIVLPLGHPGESLGLTDTVFPLTPPSHWRLAEDEHGRNFCGTSLHAPATDENVAALRVLARLGFRHVLLDDDARLARSPGQVGGCFCNAHRVAFLAAGRRPAAAWSKLLDAVRQRRTTALVRAWLGFQQAEMSGFLAALDAADPRLDITTSAMELGDEKAGIPLTNLRGRGLRVGEGHFSDAAFASVEGRCTELFSALFHRRFVRRDRSFSETTAFPHDQLSSDNLVAKLAVPLIADVGTVLFMSGVTPYPADRYAALSAALPRHRLAAAQIAGAALAGPLTHWWGEASRLSGAESPAVRWLALGVPFSVAAQRPGTGVVVAAPGDAAELATRGATVLTTVAIPGTQRVSDDWPAWWVWRRSLLAGPVDFPYVVDEEPTVCAWYPAARRVVLWEVSGRARTVTLRSRGGDQQVALPALGWCVVTVQ